MTYSNEDPDNYPDSNEYVHEFTEWLWNHAPPASIRKAQTASTSFVPSYLIWGSETAYLEYTGNLPDEQHAALVDHLLEVLEEDYQGRPSYWSEAQDWAHCNRVSAMEDAYADRSGR